jgi:hypothetical protein
MARINATTYKIPTVDPGTFTYRIKAIDTIGLYSESAASTVISISAPNPVTSLQAGSNSINANFTWTAPALTTFMIKEYKLFYGDIYETSQAVLGGTVIGAFASIPLNWNGLRKFWVVTVDTTGRMSTPVSVSLTVQIGGAHTLTGYFRNSNYIIEWKVSGTNSLVPTNWHVRFGDSFANGTQAITPVSGTATSASLTPSTASGWSTGSRRIWVAPYYESIQSYGAAVSIDATIVKPPAPTVSVAAFGSTGVKVSWVGTPGSLPIASYELRYSRIDATTNPNPTWNSPANISQTSSFDSVNITGIKTTDPYRYFVAAKDTAGVVGNPSA